MVAENNREFLKVLGVYLYKMGFFEKLDKTTLEIIVLIHTKAMSNVKY